MTDRVYDTDNGTDYVDLMRLKGDVDYEQVLPRQTVYGSSEAIAIGLDPVESVPDVLLRPDQYVDAMAAAHEARTLPLYHAQATWRPEGFQYNQDGLGYCWTWSGTGAVMTCRATEDKDTVLLAPVSMGYLVGWANRGNYLESYIKGARERGICEAISGNVNDHNNSRSYWEPYEQQRKLYLLDKVWDTRDSAMVQHCHSILAYGRSLQIAYNWWSHALELLGIRYRDGKTEWMISNSHNKTEILILTGSRAVPDEAYGFISTKLTQ